MPIYEYRCQDCESQISIWFRSFVQTETETAVCTSCGSENLRRVISRVAVVHSGRKTAEQQAAPSSSSGGSSGDDPQSLAHAMHTAANGRDLGSSFNEVAARLEQGESASAIEASLRQGTGQSLKTH